MIKYLGSKRKIIPHIVTIVSHLPRVTRVLDLFSGTTRVGQALKARGYMVHSNDTARYSEVFGHCYIGTDARHVDLTHLTEEVHALNALSGKDGFITETYARRSRFFQPHNARKIDHIREHLALREYPPVLRHILLTSLIEAADRVDSTTGVQMAYVKRWSARSHNPLELRVPELLQGAGIVSRLDANELVRSIEPCDLVYLDPPYNQHSYFSNYHIWETLVQNDTPDVYGVAMKRTECKEVKSPYNSRPKFFEAFSDMVRHIRAPYLLASFSDEGFLSNVDLQNILGEHRYVACLTLDYKRYVGAQIGIYNPAGEKVGAVSHLMNHEHLFLAGPDKRIVQRAIEAARVRRDVR